MVLKGQRHSKKKNKESKGSLASDICRMVGSPLRLEHRKSAKTFIAWFEMTLF